MTGWKSIDQQIYVPFDRTPSDFLLSIDGRSPSDLYVCGSQGFIGHWNGQKWSVIDCPVNAELNAVYCAPWGDTYFSGSSGTLLLLGADGVIQDMSNPELVPGSLYDICSFEGDVFLSGGDRLIRIVNGKWELVSAPGEESFAIYAISASDSLWCVGGENVLQFSGQDWIVHECPANKPLP